MKNSIYVALLGTSFLLATTVSINASEDAHAEEHEKVMVVTADAFGDAAAGKAKSATCAACHNVDGNSTNAEWPSLAGQSAEYTYTQLKLIKDGTRSAPLMVGQLDNMSDQDLKNLAVYFAEQEPKLGAKIDETLVKLGESIYRGGNLESGVPACAACHGVTAKGIPVSEFPMVIGQQPKYLAKALNDYANDKRSGTANQKIMREIAALMTEDEITAVAAYMHALQ